MFKLSAAALVIATAVVSQTSMALPFIPDGMGRINIKAADKDKNGTISRDEFNDFFVTSADPRDTRSMGKNMTIDSNKKGATDLVISETGRTKNTDPITPEEAATIFAQADVNGDGQIARDEAHALHKAMHDAQAMKKFAYVDTNHDGYISRKEADMRAPALAENFSKVDTNNDGKITPAELKAAHKKVKQKMINSIQSQGSSSSSSSSSN